MESEIYTLFEIIERMNKFWHAMGQTSDIVISNEHITITGKEVIVKFPVEMTLRIPAEKFDAESVSPCRKSSSEPT